jgi:hypothetical protein
MPTDRAQSLADTSLKLISVAAEQLAWVDFQCASQPFNCSDRRIAQATFQLAHVAPFHSRIERELLLSQTTFFSLRSYIPTKQRDQIHAASSQQ